MSTLMYGRGFLINPGTWTWVPTGVAAYVAPQIKAPQLVEEPSAISRLKNALGLVIGLIDPNDCILKCTYTFLPCGAAGGTTADARKAASLPQHGPFGITGLPIIQVGLFADAFNSVVGDAGAPWFYSGEGEITGAEDAQAWSGSLTLYRFFNITGASAWSSIS